VVQGLSGSTLFSGPRVNAQDLQEILNIVSRSGCELIELTDEQIEEMV